MLEFNRNTFGGFVLLQVFNLKSLLLKRSKLNQLSRLLGRLYLLMHILCTGVRWCYVPWEMESTSETWVSKKQRRHMDLSYYWYLQTCRQPGQKCVSLQHWCQVCYEEGGRELPCVGWLRLFGELGCLETFIDICGQKRQKKGEPQYLSAQKLLL